MNCICIPKDYITRKNDQVYIYIYIRFLSKTPQNSLLVLSYSDSFMGGLLCMYSSALIGMYDYAVSYQDVSFSHYCNYAIVNRLVFIQ